MGFKAMRYMHINESHPQPSKFRLQGAVRLLWAENKRLSAAPTVQNLWFWIQQKHADFLCPLSFSTQRICPRAPCSSLLAPPSYLPGTSAHYGQPQGLRDGSPLCSAKHEPQETLEPLSIPGTIFRMFHPKKPLRSASSMDAIHNTEQSMAMLTKDTLDSR
jgi:hypothetical protein